MRTILFFAINIVLFAASLRLSAQTVSPCLISSGIVTGNCPLYGDPYIESPCIAGIQKQIARSVNAENLVEWVTPVQCAYWIGTNGTPYNPSLIPAGNVPVNCAPPYDKCQGHYCPDKYCQIIKTFVDLKASIILRATNTWLNHYDLQPGTPYYQGMQQIVTDINAAYDCAGLRRPVIQATIFEHIDPAVSGVRIPADVINAFKGTPGFEASYYLILGGTPKTLNFNRERIRNISTTNSEFAASPDITRIEARMWFYYLAKMYIDMGYKSIHMGQPDLWAVNDAAYTQTVAILNKIRTYAQSKNTFVLLTQENKRALKIPGTDNFMFDYDSRAIRAREVSLPRLGFETCGDFGCTGPTNNYLAGSPCQNELYPAVIDECVISTGGNTGGYSPVSGCFLPYQPFNTYLDFGPGDYPGIGFPSQGCNGDWGTWGWDDTKWFAKGLQSPQCRAFWLQDAIPRIRSYFNGFGHMALPGLIYVNMPTNAGQYLNNINPSSDARYLLSDEALVKSAVMTSWAPNVNPAISTSATCGPVIGNCNFASLKQRRRTTRFYVSQPDNTSTYTWHIKNPDDSWQPMTYGKERSVSVSTAGVYTIYLRVDNLALPGGVKQISVEQYLEPYCCFTEEFFRAKQISDTTAMDETTYSGLPENFDELPVNQGQDDPKQSRQREVFSDDNKDVFAYPSPTSSLFTVQARSIVYNDCSLVVKDITGRTILTSAPSVNLSNGWSVTCKDWANGVYFISVSSRSGAHTTLKIVKF